MKPKTTPRTRPITYLTPAQKKQIREIYQVLKEHLELSYAEWVAGFEWEYAPQPELEIWAAIAEAYHRVNLSQRLNQRMKKVVFQILLMCSFNGESHTRASFKRDGVDPKFVQQVLNSYNGLTRPLGVVRLPSPKRTVASKLIERKP